ncbi:MAG: hypothetical protein AUK03_01385 [Anaerolineae bacterium CG2_30_64_16]|nr:MAG: hypothetical protein AUK03_01385 [Anaerolineae bacterium CG2_30_64_16]
MNPQGAKVLIVATTGPEAPQRFPAPFLFAQAAAQLGSDVSINFVLQAPLLLKHGVAQRLYAKEGGRSAREFIDDTLAAGVKFFVCDAALPLCDMTPDDLIEEVDNLVGPAFLITRGLESDLVLNF